MICPTCAYGHLIIYLSKLIYLIIPRDLSSNYLTGSIPADLPSKLYILYVSIFYVNYYLLIFSRSLKNNQLNGHIPQKLPANLHFLYVCVYIYQV